MRPEPTNDDRAAWAQKALDAFPAREKPWNGITGKEELYLLRLNAGDLIADLLHLVRQKCLLSPEELRAFVLGALEVHNEELTEAMEAML